MPPQREQSRCSPHFPFLFLLILFRGILPLRIPRSAKAICALPVFLGSFNILIYLSLSRLRERPEDLTLPLTVLSFISSVVICWGLLLILRDMLRAVAALSRLIARRCKQNSTAETASPDLSRRRFLVNGGLLLVAGAAGCVGTRNALGSPEIIPTEILCPRLPAALNGLRIVQLSDLHISDILTRAWVRDVVDRVNALRPDLIVVTGDLVDGHPRELMRHVEVLADLHAPYGVHTCTGNHDFYSGLEDWLPRFRDLGLGVLRNEHLVLNINEVPLTILGLHDLKESVRGQGPDLKLALAARRNIPSAFCWNTTRRKHQNGQPSRISCSPAIPTAGSLCRCPRWYAAQTTVLWPDTIPSGTCAFMSAEERAYGADSPCVWASLRKSACSPCVPLPDRRNGASTRHGTIP